MTQTSMELINIIHGKVQKGQERGKRLGFPTINFPIKKTIDEGIYISKVTIHEKMYKALTFIGTAKTFAETDFQAETYVLDFDEDIYGENVSIELLKKIRDNIKFDSEEALIQQMEEDKKEAEEYFK